MINFDCIWTKCTKIYNFRMRFFTSLWLAVCSHSSLDARWLKKCGHHCVITTTKMRWFYCLLHKGLKEVKGLPFAHFQLSQMYFTAEQIQRIPIVGRRKIKNESEKKVDRSAKTPNGQSIQDIVDAYFAIHCTIIPSNRGPTTLKKHDKRFFVPFNPRLEVWLIGTLLVVVCCCSRLLVV